MVNCQCNMGTPQVGRLSGVTRTMRLALFESLGIPTGNPQDLTGYTVVIALQKDGTNEVYYPEFVVTGTDNNVLSFVWPADEQSVGNWSISATLTHGDNVNIVNWHGANGIALVKWSNEVYGEDDEGQESSDELGLMGYFTDNGEGLSAYQVWLAQGNTGTEADYIADLKEPATSAATEVLADLGSRSESTSGDGTMWGDYKAAETSRDGDYTTAEASRNALYNTAEGNRNSQYATAEASRNSQYATAEGSESGSTASDGSRWGAYKGAENDRDTDYGAAEVARNGLYATAEASRNSQYGLAEDARDNQYDAAEGTASSAAGSGSRWGSYKTAEAARDTASENQEGTSASTAGDGTRWGAYKTAEASRESDYDTAEGTSASVAGDGSRWGAYKTAEAARETAYEGAEGTSASVAGDGTRWGAYKTAEAARAAEFATYSDTINAKADKDGYYASMSVGTADNLVGRGTVEAEYTFRTAGGSADIGTGSAQIDKIKGNTIVWNQLVGTSATSVTVASGHIIITKIDGTWARTTADGNAIAVTGGTDMVIDLTLMGVAATITSVAEFRALYPLDYYAYNAGQLVSNAATGIQTVGFNQWDEQWELGGISNSTGANTTDSTRIRSKNFIQCSAATNYYVKVPSNCAFRFYDAGKNFIGVRDYDGSSVTSSRVFKTPNNCAFFRFILLNTTTYNNNICINLSWSGYRNGEYESYWTSNLALNLPTITGKLNGEGSSVTIFPDGLRSAGTVYDEANETGATVRIGKVDLGTLEWTIYTVNLPTVYRVQLEGKQFGINNIKSDKYCVSTANAAQNVGNNECYGSPSTTYIYIRDDNYEDDAASFKASLSGVYLYYELATPLSYTWDEALSLGYRVDDFGTEKRLPADTASAVTAPISYSVKYAMNAVDTLRRLGQNYIKKESMDNILTALKTAGIISAYTLTYNSTNDEYDCTITAPTTE